MKNEFNELRYYFNEAKRRTQNDRYNYCLLTNYSEQAIEQIKKIKLKIEDAEEIEACEKAIEELKKVAELSEQYSATIKYPEMIGNFQLFLKINHTLYNNLEVLLEYFDELEEK